MTATYRIEDSVHPTDEWREQCGLFVWERKRYDLLLLDIEEMPGMTLYTVWLNGVYRGCTPNREFARTWCRKMNGERP